MKKLQGENLAQLERQNRDRFLDRLEVDIILKPFYRYVLTLFSLRHICTTKMHFLEANVFNCGRNCANLIASRRHD